ncbi:esterase/lipase family protein [Acetivibrio cellulolyticus]|uniref:esterase/lipase family protein n=1 Tax=Acetivibrio cellulolyticus TaxID=35830 RepID=UPI0001E2D4EF|nr:alpha/beta hydrolase [Acetivibrio cellulolyticus]
MGSYILITILFLAIIFMDIIRKINLTNKLLMSVLIIIVPHTILAAAFISKMQSFISAKYLTVIYVLFAIYIWIKVSISPYSKKQIDDFRVHVLVGGRRLILYSLYSGIAQIPFYMLLNRFVKSSIPPQVFVTDIILTVIFISSLYLNGILRIIITSKQLSIIKKILIIIYMWIPIVNLFFIVYLGNIVKAEYERELYRILNRNVRIDSEICKTKYPLIMLHGIGFKDFKYFNYWGRIPGELKRHGATIYYGNHEAWATIEDNGEFLKQRILEIIKTEGCEKVNIIAHSRGGLDARYMISMLGMSDHVASLTTISTPHHGAKIIDIIYKLPEPLINLIGNRFNKNARLMGDKKPDIFVSSRQLTISYCEEFNKSVRDSEKVYYQSFAAVMNNIFSDYILTIPNLILRLVEGENDGFVSIESSKWGEFKGVLSTKHNRGISHGDLIDLRRNDYEGFDAREKYIEIVSGLKNMGF